ncbi:MAG: glycine oxidase ThiO [Saprospiraceae bacterium]|nr:glycine oxidase ThiO [Pyrinomonadaceae bacterium]
MRNSEVLIIGGGVIGLSIAREMHKIGAGRITIIERGSIGREASFAAAGMLAPNAETDKIDDFYNFCAESNRLYPDFAAALLDETGIDIELDRSGTLYLAFTGDDSIELKKRFDWQTSAGLAVEHLNTRETLTAEPFISPNVRESLFFPNDWQVENRKLLEALRKYSEINGIRIREGTEIREILTAGEKVIGAASDSEKFLAGTTIIATGAWTSLIKIGEMPVSVKVKPIRGQMISFHPREKLFKRVIYSSRGYLVPRADGRILAGSTVEDVGFDKSTTETGVSALRCVASEIAPCLAGMTISDKWAGLRPYADDGLPVIGEIAGFKNLIISTGHYRNGILLAPFTAKIVAERNTGFLRRSLSGPPAIAGG